MIIPGVYFSATEAGFKPGRLDLGMVYVPDAVASAGVFTTNHIKAACVQVTQKTMARHVIKAILVNAGNANAATGPLGIQHAKQSAAWVAKALGLKPGEVAVASTGVIGRPLPMDCMERGIAQLTHHPFENDMDGFASAIMTTDLVKKMAHVTIDINGQPIQLLGFAKGSGMIAPNMATMLGFIVTDATIDSPTLQRLLSEVNRDTFNCITVDTDTSTNDMVLAVASGKTPFPSYQASALAKLKAGLMTVCESLAMQIARDGEGATKLMVVSVTGAASQSDALLVARSIAESPLVKTAMHGADPNWGRVAMAVGKTSAKVMPQRLCIRFGPHLMMQDGEPVAWQREAVASYLKSETIAIDVALHVGKHKARVWGCDLTKGYIEINVDYN